MPAHAPREHTGRCESRPSTSPAFVYSRPHGSLITWGAESTFPTVDDGIRALESERASTVVGALPFSRDDAPALTSPARCSASAGPLEPPARLRAAARDIRARITYEDPEPYEHLTRVEAAVATIAQSRLDKVVLARAVDVAFDSPIDPLWAAAWLVDNSPQRDGFSVDLSAAGGSFTGVHLVGSSPEVLVRCHGTTVTAFPLAGSLPRHADPEQDATAARALAASAKDLDEHRYVVEHLRRALGPLCRDLEIPERPELTSTKHMWHLATPIRGEVREDRMISALELAQAVHPTPAICGTPTDPAEDVIATVESDRGFYAGAVGWSNARGDGEFMVAIRCAQIAADGASARTWAGGGIVAESNPADELAETTAKLQTMLSALGVH